MRDQEIVGLWEAYSSIYESPDSDVVNENIQDKVRGALDKGVEIGKKIEKNPVLGPLMSIMKPVRRGTDRGPVTPTHHNVANRQEQFETWVNDLVEEGYDLSDYTWNDMYEMFMNLDEDAKYDRNRRRAAQRAAARNAARKQGKTGSVPGVGYVSPRPERETYIDSAGVERHTSGARMHQKEQTDLFDYILEHLVAEGYADTNDAALSIMANMSEEWKQSIVGDLLDEGEKPFPDEKVKAKQAELRRRGGNAPLERRMRMGLARRRAKEARRTGDSQQSAGAGWYHGR